MNLKDIKNGKLIHDDCLEAMQSIPDNSLDTIVTDPPYGYSFMGKNWDKGLPDIEIFKECLRVLKPGAFAFVMAAPRQDMLSRMIIKLEDVGFKTDFTSIYWTYATGFTKAHNIGKTIDKKLEKEREVIGTRKQHDIRCNGYGSKKSEFIEELKGGAVSDEAKQFEGSYGGFQPKPAVEVIIVVQKPKTQPTQVGQALDNGKGVTWLDDCRIPYSDGDKSSAGNRTATFGTQETISGGNGSGVWKMCKEGRFPANLLVSDDVLQHESKGALAPVKLGQKGFGGEIYGKYKSGGDDGRSFYSDKETSTSYSRFFSLDAWAQRNLPFLIVPKANKKEKDTGCKSLHEHKIVSMATCNGTSGKPSSITKGRNTRRRNIHPTVKPIKLMSYLITMGSREGDIVLDPFCGSGTTCVASMLLGRRFIGIEKEAEYHDIAKERLSNITRASKQEAPSEPESPIIRLSEIESITLRYHDNSVLDMASIKTSIDKAFENPIQGIKTLGNMEIDTVLIPEISATSPPEPLESSIYQKMIEGTSKRNRAKRNPKIISVSRRTDIPAFYSDWFFNRVKEGVALVKKKVDSPKIKKVFLEPEDVRCFVLWTKNPRPMFERLNELDGYKYYFQFTLTPYGPDIEKNLPPKDELIETFIRLSERIGKEKVIWRYDPIILTDTIDIEYHKQHFEALVKRLHRHTEKCVISFVETRKIQKAAREAMKLKTIDIDMKWELASWIQFIAEGYGLKVEACAQKIDFSEIGITPARCVDPRLIGHITGFPVKIAKDTKQRKKCGCVPSTEIGTNNTCTHGCLYCYATREAAQARLNYHQHDCESPAMTIEMEVNGKKERDNVQDWADKGINISKGCSNNCRYCYAREESVRRHGNVYENWVNEQLNQKIIKKGWRKTSKRLMFPTTHDITPGTYDACESALKKLLGAGNQVLVVSKPRFDLIEKLCDALEPYKARMMFRFTISARNNEILSFWEPNAPSYEDRVDALIIAHAKGFRTSVSIEPMLDPADIKGLVEDLRGFTTDSMWIGPVKMIRKRTRIDSEEIEREVQKIETGQTPEKLMEVYNLYKNDPLIKWKGHFRKLLRKIGIEVPEQNDDWRDRL